MAKSVLNEKMRPELPANIPAAMRELIELCWDQDHSRRPTAKEIIGRLDEIHRKGNTIYQSFHSIHAENLKPAVAAPDSGYRKKLADSCDETNDAPSSFIELSKKDENNYVLGNK